MSYVIIGVVVAIAAVVVFVIARKDAQECQEMVSKLTEDQKNLLMSTKVNFVEKNAWTQDAMVAKIVDKGNKFNIRLLWYNSVIENNEYNTITIADASISKEEQEKHNLKIGDKVTMYFAPEKTIGSVKIMFE